MSCLHSLSSSPQSISLQRMRASLGDDDAVLLMADGVYCCDQLAAINVPVYVIAEDADARGVAHTMKAINYQDMVELVIAHAKQVSWG